jgi:hypothetical protein
MFTWSRYLRFWAVWNGTQLICVTVYRKGAREVTRVLNELASQLQQLKEEL